MKLPCFFSKQQVNLKRILTISSSNLEGVFVSPMTRSYSDWFDFFFFSDPKVYLWIFLSVWSLWFFSSGHVGNNGDYYVEPQRFKTGCN